MRTIRLGQVGGGPGAMIGAVHRAAARIDDRFGLVAGAFASTEAKSRAMGAELGLDPKRVYADFERMAANEAARDDGIEAVSIVTPNHLHARAAMAFLRRGVHVICDKPLTSTLDDALALKRAVADSGAVFVLTHNYSAYPMVRQARAMVADGDLGRVRVVQVEYAQDWLSRRVEQSGHKGAAWRADPARAGAGGAIGDIGTHAYHLARFVTGLDLEKLTADLSCMVDGRVLDDNANVLLRLSGGARGMLWACQVAPGHENGLRLRVYGEKGGLAWGQEDPNHLLFTPLGGPTRRITRGGAGAGVDAAAVTRWPAGHPEGYLEGFANIYREAADAIEAGTPAGTLLPTIDDGVEGVAFVAACVRSSKDGGAWVGL